MYKYIKHTIDRLIAFLLIIMVSPLFVICIVLLWIFNKRLSNVFFIQQRPGLGGTIFKVIKFKTMTDDRDAEGNLLADHERLTWIGSLIRKTSMDELPQLLNILKGDMSFVGPRPLLVEYLPLYNEKQSRRHMVKPGISGWAQVNGRNLISWDKRFEYDVWYVENQSFWLDFKILLMTVVKVLKSEGISAENSSTMEKFRGNHI